MADRHPPMIRTDANLPAHVEILPLDFHGASIGIDETDRIIHSLLFRPKTLGPGEARPKDLFQVLLSEQDKNDLMSSIQSNDLALRMEKTGENN